MVEKSINAYNRLESGSGRTSDAGEDRRDTRSESIHGDERMRNTGGIMGSARGEGRLAGLVRIG